MTPFSPPFSPAGTTAIPVHLPPVTLAVPANSTVIPADPTYRIPDCSNCAVSVPFTPQGRENIFIPQGKENISHQTSLAEWENLFGSKLPWKMANGSYTDEIEYMVELQKNNKLASISSPVGYLRAIHNSIPLNWKTDVLKKKQEAEEKQLKQTHRLKEEETQNQEDARQTALDKQALKYWNAMAQDEKQP